MKEKEEVVNINFFKKVWYSITKFEQYPAMATEGLKRAIKYIVLLSAIVTVFVMIGSLLQMKMLINNLANYVQDNIPEFTYSEGKLSVQSEETIIIENIEYSGIDKIIIDTVSQTVEQKEQVERDNIINGTTIIFFKDEIILESKSENQQILKQSYLYNDFVANYAGESVTEFNKGEFIQYLTSEKMLNF